jgi:hypothetical protein
MIIYFIRSNSRITTLLIWSIIVISCFNKWAYEIININASTRLLLRTGNSKLREFNERGIPISHNAKTKLDFISPFYVVHYGIIYSECIENKDKTDGYHWNKDLALSYWNIHPDIVKSSFFEESAEWIVSNIKTFKGHSHLLYNFDWPYKNYPHNKLTAPWWSGLTDGYAIILLLRAHDIFGNAKYLTAAEKLYKSVLAPVESGGSTLLMNGLPWIEEYIDPSVPPKDMSRVLNGMIYAYYGIKSFEEHKGISSIASKKLALSIKSNFHNFSLGNWSYYDSIGNSANIKYHRIHVALLKDFIEGDEELATLSRRWSKGAAFPCFYWLTSPGWPFVKSHFLGLLLLVLGMGYCGIFAISHRRHKYD